jgi:hypothetical protein
MYQKKQKMWIFGIRSLEKDSKSGSKDEKGRRNNKKAPIGDRDALEVKGGRVMEHVSLLDLCKTPFCRRRRPY